MQNPSNLNPYEVRHEDSTLSLTLNNGYNHHIDLKPPKFTFCPKCYDEQVYHIKDDVCVMCGYSKTELDLSY